ncbi:hypothetical protein WJX82_003785 [Trebouxia sp. C0006]
MASNSSFVQVLQKLSQAQNIFDEAKQSLFRRVSTRVQLNNSNGQSQKVSRSEESFNILNKNYIAVKSLLECCRDVSQLKLTCPQGLKTQRKARQQEYPKHQQVDMTALSPYCCSVKRDFPSEAATLSAVIITFKSG